MRTLRGSGGPAAGRAHFPANKRRKRNLHLFEMYRRSLCARTPCVVTLPLGVLKAGAVAFSPPLPECAFGCFVSKELSSLLLETSWHRFSCLQRIVLKAGTVALSRRRCLNELPALRFPSALLLFRTPSRPAKLHCSSLRLT